MGQREGGHFFPLEMTTSGMSLGGERYHTCILRDITERRRVASALVQASALQQAIFQSVNFSSIATDAKGVIQIFNVGAEEMLGYSAAEVVDKVTPADLSDPQEVIERAEALSLELATPISPGFDALAFKAYRGIEDIYELTLVCKDGTRFPAVVSVTALRDPSNLVIGYLLIATDNSARKRVEEERARLDQALQDKNTELELAISVADKANQAKSEFLSSMSHELRSPLNAILGFAQLMDSATPPATPTQKASIDRILHAGWYLLELINEILDLAVIESGRLSLSEEPVSLAEVFSDCRSMLEPQAAKRGLTLTFPAFAEPVFVRADRIRFKQVLVNLLSNAVKYNRPGGSVLVDCTQATEGRVRISVRDTGQGLTPEQLRQLFQPFNRLGQEHSAEEGTGIGLVMSKLLVELMGGKLGVSSTPGAGSVFWYDLNASAAPVLLESKVDSATATLALPTLRPSRTVLYVEDNPANLALIEQLVARRPDLILLSANDAMAGLKIARESLPDVILMDINLPGINGHQALKILRETPSIAHIPTLAISANAMVGDIQKGLEEGFFRYLTKPIIVSEFMAALDEALDAAQQIVALHP
jgi:signal transduction histidine kinase/ActR/RegA family two-component response regulator